jgi:homoserine O-acetyltransferase
MKHLPNAFYHEIPGVYGHFAGGGLCDEDTDFIDQRLKELLAMPPSPATE